MKAANLTATNLIVPNLKNSSLAIVPAASHLPHTARTPPTNPTNYKTTEKRSTLLTKWCNSCSVNRKTPFCMAAIFSVGGVSFTKFLSGSRAVKISGIMSLSNAPYTSISFGSGVSNFINANICKICPTCIKLCLEV